MKKLPITRESLQNNLDFDDHTILAQTQYTLSNAGTESIIKNLGKRGVRRLLVVPIAFTSDHIETLFEIGEEYAELAEEVGIKEFRFTEGMNGSETFISALADIVQGHIESKTNCSSQYKMKCVTCVKPLCRKILNPAYPNALAAEI